MGKLKLRRKKKKKRLSFSNKKNGNPDCLASQHRKKNKGKEVSSGYVVTKTGLLEVALG